MTTQDAALGRDDAHVIVRQTNPEHGIMEHSRNDLRRIRMKSNETLSMVFSQHTQIHLIHLMPLLIPITYQIIMDLRESGKEGGEYLIPLLEQQKNSQRDNLKQSTNRIQKDKVEQSRIILKGGFVLVIKLIEKVLISFSLHFKHDFKQFMHVEYCFTQFSKTIQHTFKDLQTLYSTLCQKDKHSVRFQTSGALTLLHKSAPEGMMNFMHY